MSPDLVIRETYFTRKPERSGSLAALSSIIAIFSSSVIFWENRWNLATWLPASGETVLHQNQYWRLLTGILIHSDFMHFLSNAVPLAFFSSLLYGYFGFTIFPQLMLALGCLIHLISLLTYPPEASLIGASGVVYCMAAFWLTLYVLIERRFSLGKRMFRSIGFILIVLVPSAFDPSVSYRAHAIGFILGVIAGVFYFGRNRKAIRDAEILELEGDSEDEIVH